MYLSSTIILRCFACWPFPHSTRAYSVFASASVTVLASASIFACAPTSPLIFIVLFMFLFCFAAAVWFNQSLSASWQSSKLLDQFAACFVIFPALLLRATSAGDQSYLDFLPSMRLIWLSALCSIHEYSPFWNSVVLIIACLFTAVSSFRIFVFSAHRWCYWSCP